MVRDREEVRAYASAFANPSSWHASTFSPRVDRGEMSSQISKLWLAGALAATWGILRGFVMTLVARPEDVSSSPKKVVNDDGAKMKAFVYLVFPNSIVSALPKGSSKLGGEPMEHGIISSVTHGVMSVDDYLHCLQRERAASAKLSGFLRRSLQLQQQEVPPPK
ncbi:hypothetical protein LguiB_027920 [Lonicera macranthoides]